MASTSVLLADDHRRVADAVGEYVADAFELVGTVQDGGALLEAAQRLRPDVVVVDISMPGTDGFTALKQIRHQLPHTRVILLTNHDDPMLVRYALKAGAAGFVLKVYASTELVHAIRTVVDNGIFVSSAIAV